MTRWNYEMFTSMHSGREGVTELEYKVTEKLESLEGTAAYAKVVMTNILGGSARGVVYYPESASVPSIPAGRSISGWVKVDVNTIADSSETERYKEEMYQEILELLNALSGPQAILSKLSATAYKDGYATLTLWYPETVS